MPPLPPHLRRPLTVRFQQSLRTIGTRTSPALARAWTGLDAYNEADIEAFTTKTAPALNAAKFAAVRQAAGYYALTAGVRAVGVKADLITTQPDTRAPFIATWLALKNGTPFEEALTNGASRLDAVADNFIVSSARQTGDVVAERAGLQIRGWERVPDGDTCPWCLEVSPGFYTSAESADFGHDRCGCSAEPIYS